MKIAACMETFPAITETYILWHLEQLLLHDHTLTILPAALGNTSLIQPEVAELGMLEMIRAPAPLVSQKQAPLDYYQQQLMTALLAAQRHPEAMLRLLGSLRGTANIGWFQAVRFMASVQPPRDLDIIHGYFGPSARRAELLRRLGLLKGPLIASFLGFDLGILGTRLGPSYYSHVFARAERLTVATRFMERKLLELGAPAERVALLPLGLPVARFPFKPRVAPERGPVRMITVARLTEFKGTEWGLRALAIAVQRHSDLRWDIVGDGPLRQRLELLCDELGLRPYVTFHGSLLMEQVRALMEQAHLCLFPGIRAADGAEEALGGAVLEAQAMGMPVLVTNAGGLAEGMVTGVSGLCVQQRDPEAMADAIDQLINRADEWPEMGAAGRAHILKHYDSAQLHARWMQLYDSVR